MKSMIGIQHDYGIIGVRRFIQRIQQSTYLFVSPLDACKVGLDGRFPGAAFDKPLMRGRGGDVTYFTGYGRNVVAVV